MANLIGKIDPTKTIHIIGAGASGLILAHYLKQKNLSFKIYEKENRVGGLISTEKTNYGLVETAANALFTNDDVIDLLKDLKLTWVPANPKIRRLIVRKHNFLRFPFYIKELPKLIWRLFTVKPPQEKNLSLKQFLLPWMGEDICDEVVSTGLLGIYASDSANIDQESFFPIKDYPSYFAVIREFIKVRKLSRQKYNTRESVSFSGGMQEFIDALKNELSSHIIYTEIKELPSNAIVCTNAHDASHLLKHSHPEVSACLSKIKYQSVYTFTAFTEKEYTPLHQAFGILLSRKSPFYSLGILANHEIFPGRVTKGYSYTFIKHAGQGDENEIDQDRKGLNFPPLLFKKSKLWPKAIPVYSVNRRCLIDDIRKSFDNNNVLELALFGNYVDGISLREIITTARAFTQKL